MSSLASFIIPLIVLVIIAYGYKRKVNIYDSFLTGAKEGLLTTFNIFPTIIAMVFAINVFLRSDFLIFMFSFMEGFFSGLNLPLNILPMIFLRPISGGVSLAILNDILAGFGPDSFAGILSSVIQASTDTTFYVLAIYFGSVRIKKGGYALPVALAADLISIMVAIILVSILFS